MEMQTKSPQLIANNIKHNDLALDFRPIGLQNFVYNLHSMVYVYFILNSDFVFNIINLYLN